MVVVCVGYADGRRQLLPLTGRRGVSERRGCQSGPRLRACGWCRCSRGCPGGPGWPQAAIERGVSSMTTLPPIYTRAFTVRSTAASMATIPHDRTAERRRCDHTASLQSASRRHRPSRSREPAGQSGYAARDSNSEPAGCVSRDRSLPLAVFLLVSDSPLAGRSWAVLVYVVGCSAVSGDRYGNHDREFVIDVSGWRRR
jgi:hypothetical protein